MEEDRDIAKEIIEGVEAASDYMEGKQVGKAHQVTVETVDVKALREKLGLTQKHFAHLFGFTLNSVRNWEQGRRRPERPARLLLHLIDEDPEGMLRKVRELEVT